MTPGKHRHQRLARSLLAGVFISLGIGLGGLVWPTGANIWTPEKARELNSAWGALHRSTERHAPPPPSAELEHSETTNASRAENASLPEKASQHDDAIRRRYDALREELEYAKAQRSPEFGWVARVGLIAAVFFGAAYLAYSGDADEG